MSETKIQRWGNSMALRVPASMLRAWGVAEGQALVLSVEGGALIARPARSRYRLAELLDQCDFSIPSSAQERDWVDGPALGLEDI